jgi:hypothetical protein
MKKVKYFIFITCFYFAAQTLTAQPSSGGGGPAACFPPSTPCVPIDGGVGFLIAAGIALGSKKAFEFHKKKKNNSKGL